MIICQACGTKLDKKDYGYTYCPVCKSIQYFRILTYK